MAITIENVDTWAHKYDLKKLHKALKVYDYKVRLAATRHLGMIGNRDSLSHLQGLIEDPFLSVLEEARKAIATISPNHESLKAFDAQIEKKKGEEEERKARTETNFRLPDEEEERAALEQMAKDYDIAKIYQKGLKEEKSLIINWWYASLVLGLVSLLTWLLFG